MTLEILCNRTAGRLRILIENVSQDRKCTVDLPRHFFVIVPAVLLRKVPIV